MKCAIIEDNIIINIGEIDSEEDLISSDMVLIEEETAQIGDRYDGKYFYAPDGSRRYSPMEALENMIDEMDKMIINAAYDSILIELE